MAFKRNTPISQNVLRILQSSSQPLCIAGIKAKLKLDGLAPNKSTLYRIIEKLKASTIIVEALVKNGVYYYEYQKDNETPHHHFSCTTCDKIYCLKQPTSKSNSLNFNNILPSHNFSISHHNLTIFGACETCNTSQKA